MDKRKLIWMIPLGIVGFTVFIVLGGVVVMQLWNWLTPSLFGWPPLGFAQALGLLALCRILFGRFGMNGGGGPRGYMRRRMFERWEKMGDEERERIRHSMRGAGGGGAVGSETGRS